MGRIKIPDYFISLAILIVSVTGATLTYAHIRNTRINTTMVIPSIPLGEQNFVVKSGGGCAGTISASLLALNNVFEYRANGNVRVKLKGETFDLRLTVDSQFNSIGQLGASVFRITGPQGNVSFGSTEISPINIKIRINTDALRTEQSFQIPGPIELKRNGKHMFHIEYSKLDSLMRGTQRLFSNPLVKSIDLSVLAEEDSKGVCKSLTSTAVDFDPAVSTMRLFADSLKAYVPDMKFE